MDCRKQEVKVLAKSHGAKTRRELHALRKLQNQSPFIVRLLRVEEDTQSFALVMEHIGVTLFDHVKRCAPLPEREARILFLQMVEAVQVCHKNLICHRGKLVVYFYSYVSHCWRPDLKLENFLFDEHHHRLCLIDFGLCGLIRPGMLFRGGHSCGSFPYAGAYAALSTYQTSPLLAQPLRYCSAERTMRRWTCGVWGCCCMFCYPAIFPSTGHQMKQHEIKCFTAG